jgi:flagellin-like hook-associated protein FlgL
MSTDSIERLRKSKRMVLIQLTSQDLSTEQRGRIQAQLDFIQEQLDHLKESATSGTNLPELRARDLVA